MTTLHLLAVLIGCTNADKAEETAKPTPTNGADDTDTTPPYYTDTDTSDTAPPERDCSLPDGSEWGLLADGIEDAVLLGAWSNGPDQALMVGGDFETATGALVRYDRNDGLCLESGVTDGVLWWIHGSAPDSWYAVGEQGIILRSEAGVRTREDIDLPITLYGVYDDGKTVWAVGGNPFLPNTGQIWRREGGTWSPVAQGLPGVVFKVWDGWFIGDGLSYRWVDGKLVEVPNPERLLTVRGRTGDDVYAVGGLASPVMVKWDGGAWAPFDIEGVFAPLNGIWTGEGEDLWIAGFSGVVGRHDGTAWELPSPPVSTEHFHAAWGHCNEMLFVGGNLAASSDYHGTVVRYGLPRAEQTVEACAR